MGMEVPNCLKESLLWLVLSSRPHNISNVLLRQICKPNTRINWKRVKHVVKLSDRKLPSLYGKLFEYSVKYSNPFYYFCIPWYVNSSYILNLVDVKQLSSRRSFMEAVIQNEGSLTLNFPSSSSGHETISL